MEKQNAFADMWAQFRKMPVWGQVAVGLLTSIVLLGVIGAIAGGGSDSGDEKNQAEKNKPAPTPEVRLSIVSPRNGRATTRRNSIRVVGAASPGAAITVGRLRPDTNFADPIQARLNGTRFSATVRLKLGQNNVGVLAKQPGYEDSTEFLVIVRKRTLAQLAAIRERRAAERARKEAARLARQRAREAERARKTAEATLTFSGNGGKNLGTVDVPMDSTLTWTNDGDIFQIFSDEGGLFVNSQANSGTTDAPTGTYSGVLVNAIGNWMITIKPR
jgi:hypothetical protein